ncbi:MAG: ATP-binding protein [Desulfobulbaceae bacterium]|jgi:hypothetical protein|nr:ATP-binding protein [Desulfobulbaceae bacterium]
MDRITNPFSPGAGAPPPKLAGREAILEQGRALFGRIKARRPEKNLLMTGLRGVGKTVLLNEMERMAIEEGYRTISIAAHEDKSLALFLIPQLRHLLFELNNRVAGADDKVRRGLAVLKSFISGIQIPAQRYEIGLDIDSEQGAADSGDLEIDIPNLFLAVAEATDEHQTPVALLIDEMQYLRPSELNALIVAMHKIQQQQLPLLLVGAGLPILPGLTDESKFYAERLFSFPEIGPLSEGESMLAIKEPIESAGESIEDAALQEIFRLTKGYPYSLQEWGYQLWNQAERSPLSVALAQKITDLVAHRLDENFFRAHSNRLTPREKMYLRAMAELGAEPYRTADIADTLGVKINSLGPLRSTLIKKGMIYSPSHGNMAFTVPLFNAFMKRAIPEFSPIH